ncbi:TIGR02270 family protein [Myxococcus sp. SDU36]|uniref:TIGR02270 family protein n=1 Tax=Myxococcus sp. SDU36 TaxID=2831967 RepID=UPI002543BA9D|nr:TIGR02270 family protein [Myxococcus sp. SDU36]WIG94123.1 TIGR02270 family protein [Myxococcus sp. SDU36]
MSPLPPRRPTVRWELLERHLEEAEFLWTQWEHALWSPEHTLSSVAQGDEGRLRAHLDALVLGGRAVATRLLLPALASEEPSCGASATWALLSAEDPDWREPVLRHLEEGPEETQPGILRALELLDRADLHALLLTKLPTLTPALQAGLLRVARTRHLDASDALEQLDWEADPAPHAEALRALPFLPRTQEGDARLSRALSHPHPTVSTAALETGLLLGSREAWERARGSSSRAALLTLAVAGEAKDLAALTARLKDPAADREVLWALGFSGRMAAADALLPLTRDEAQGALALASFAAITGLPLAPPFLVDASADDESTPEDLHEALPRPEVPPATVDAQAVETWWARRRGGFTAEQRYLRGAPLTAQTLSRALETEPMRRRPSLAWEIALRSGGALLVEPRQWSQVQRAQARPLGGQGLEWLTRTGSQLQGR